MASSPSSGSRAPLSAEGGERERGAKIYRWAAGEIDMAVEGAGRQDGLCLRCQLWSLQLCSVTQSCLTVCDPMDCSPLGSSVHGILQARIPEQVASVWGWLFTHSVVLSQKLHHTLNSKQEVIPITELSAVLTQWMVPE